MALRREIIDLVRLDTSNQPRHGTRVAQVAVMKFEGRLVGVRIRVDVIQAAGVESTGPANDAVDLVSLGQQKLGKIRTVLSCDTCNQRFLRHRKEAQASLTRRRKASQSARAEGFYHERMDLTRRKQKIIRAPCGPGVNWSPVFAPLPRSGGCAQDCLPPLLQPFQCDYGCGEVSGLPIKPGR